MKTIITSISFFIFSISIYSQSNNSQLPTSIRTDGQVPDPSAILDVDSDSKGVLIPRVTNAQMTAIASPATGLLVYNTDVNAFYFYDGTTWSNLSSGGSGGGPTDEIVDVDFDTKVEVDDGTDHDKIKFKLPNGSGGSVEAFKMEYDSGNKNSRLVNDPYDNNLLIGFEAGENNDSDDASNFGGNTFVGVSAGRDNTIGDRNTFIGSAAGATNVDGIQNTFLGYSAGALNSTGSDNMFLGSQAALSNTTGFRNVFIGSLAGYDNTTADQNVGIGYGALKDNNTGSSLTYHSNRNTAVGYEAGTANTLGDENTYLGYLSGRNVTEGRFNTNVGAHAGKENISGDFNVYLGHGTARYSVAGEQNVLLGAGAGNSNDQDHNVMVGSFAGSNNDGERNVFLGFNAGYSSGTGSNNVFLGYLAGRNETGSNKLYIENSATSFPLVYGDFASNIFRTNGTLQVSDPLVSGYAFPASDGASGQVMTTNGTGGLSWTTPSLSPWQYNSATNDIYTTIDHVGIGTSSPNSLLHLSTGSAEAKGIVIDNTNANGTGIEIDMNDSGQNNSFVKGIISEAQPRAYAGYFDGRLETTTVLNLEEKSTAPSNANSYVGDLYMDNGTNTNSSQRGLRYYDGSTWEDVEEELIAFSGYLSSNTTINSGSQSILNSFTEEYDEGNNFDPSTGLFTATSDGIYQFHIKISWDSSMNLDDKRIYLRLYNGSSLFEQVTYIEPLQNTYNNSTTFNPIVKLNANDVISLRVLHYAGVDLDVYGTSAKSFASRFSGFKIK